LHALHERTGAAQHPRNGDDVPCTKCMSLDRIRVKLRRSPDRIAS
jgi:hypothetical protein